VDFIQPEARMTQNKSWSDWWWKFLGFAPNAVAQSLEVLTRRYIEEKQHIARFTAHAQRMRYPQFRDKLLAIAATETKHADWLAEKITALGGRLPDVPAASMAKRNSWRYMLDDLAEEQLCADELFEEARELRDSLPSVSELLERIYQDESAYQGELRKMLMRSDPQAR
jgi:bacterioferritin (cytochrome b1)